MRVERPLSRGIQRFTGITQGMVDAAPPPGGGAAASSADLLRGPRAGRPQRALRRARAAPGVRARRARVARAARAVHGRSSPAASRRCSAGAALAPLAGALGIEVDEVAPRAARRPHVRARVLRAVPEAVRERARRSATRSTLLRLAPAALRKTGAGRGVPRDQRPDLSDAAGRPRRLRLPRRRRAAAVRRQVGVACARARGRTSAPPRAGPSDAEHVDYRPTNSELGALVLENRLIKALEARRAT